MRDLEHLSPDLDPPVLSGRYCPTAHVPIRAEACEQRKKAHHAEPLRRLCAGEACTFYKTPSHRYGDRPIPPGAKVTRSGRVMMSDRRYVEPCQECAGWKTERKARCVLCERKSGVKVQKMHQAVAELRQAGKRCGGRRKKAAVPAPRISIHIEVNGVAWETQRVVELLKLLDEWKGTKC